MISIPNMSPEALTRLLATVPPHYQPILTAVRDHGCGYVMVLQDTGPFTLSLSPKRPRIIVVGDDLHEAKGPGAFHRPSLRRVIEQCGAAFVIASCAEEPTYRMACRWPIERRRHVAIIETLPAHEDAWVSFAEDCKPDISIMVSRVDPLARPEPQTWGRA